MSRTLVLAAALAVLLLPFSASAAEINRSWDALAATLKSGRTVVVTLMDKTTVEGKLLAIDTHSMTVQQGGGQRSIEGSDVLRVRYAGTRKRHAVYGMLIGMAAGAGALVAVDQASSHPSTKTEAAVMGAIFFGLPGGAIAGALAPTGQPLYEAATVVRKAP